MFSSPNLNSVSFKKSLVVKKNGNFNVQWQVSRKKTDNEKKVFKVNLADTELARNLITFSDLGYFMTAVCLVAGAR